MKNVFFSCFFSTHELLILLTKANVKYINEYYSSPTSPPDACSPKKKKKSMEVLERNAKSLFNYYNFTNSGT